MCVYAFKCLCLKCCKHVFFLPLHNNSVFFNAILRNFFKLSVHEVLKGCPVRRPQSLMKLYLIRLASLRARPIMSISKMDSCRSITNL